MRAMISIALLSLGVSLCVRPSIAVAAPFSTADQNPLLNGFALNVLTPARLPARGTTDLSATLNWSSIASIQRSDTEVLVLDAESREWRLRFEHGLAEKLAISIQIPYRTSSGGTLDKLIDNWHSLLGVSNADRPALPQNDLRLSYRRNDQSLFSLTNSTAAIGDVSLAMGYQLVAAPKLATSLWLNVKAPTGDSAKLTGSGAIDASLTLAHERAIGKRWAGFAQASGIYLSSGDLLPRQQRHWVASGTLGFDYRYSQSLTVTVQLDGRTAVFKDSGLNLLGNAWIMTVGGEYRWRSQWRAQFGIGEDVKVDASPDVNFVFSVAKEWR